MHLLHLNKCFGGETGIKRIPRTLIGGKTENNQLQFVKCGDLSSCANVTTRCMLRPITGQWPTIYMVSDIDGVTCTMDHAI